MESMTPLAEAMLVCIVFGAVAFMGGFMFGLSDRQQREKTLQADRNYWRSVASTTMRTMEESLFDRYLEANGIIQEVRGNGNNDQRDESDEVADIQSWTYLERINHGRTTY